MQLLAGGADPACDGQRFAGLAPGENRGDTAVGHCGGPAGRRKAESGKRITAISTTHHSLVKHIRSFGRGETSADGV